MQFIVFTDPRYHAEQHIELDPAQVVRVEEKTVRLIMDGQHRVTVVTLQNGERPHWAGSRGAANQAAKTTACIGRVSAMSQTLALLIHRPTL
jgi:hypothetical protein